MKTSEKTQSKKKARYRHAEGKRWIEVRVRDIQQLFDQRDPAPFRERELSDDFVRYIVSSAREFSLSTPLKLVIYVEGKEYQALTPEEIKEAIYSYFAYQTELQSRELREFMKRSQYFLFMGMLVLISCIGLAQGIEMKDSPRLWGVLREGIIIFGWVSMWKPFESLLYDWFPLYEKRRFYEKFVSIEIDVQFR